MEVILTAISKVQIPVAPPTGLTPPFAGACVAVCCSLLQFVAVCCSLLQFVVANFSLL